MHFIFPKNYNFKPKLFGLIEYSTALIDSIIGFILFNLLNVLFESMTIKIYIFIGIFFPILLISILGISKESIASVFKYLLKYFYSQKIYIFKK